MGNSAFRAANDFQFANRERNGNHKTAIANRVGEREENLVLFDFPQSYWSRIQFCANNQHPENQ
jgi:hypothetical protein